MNIALAYSGQPRNIIECWQNHQKYILNPNKRDKNQIYIFAHFWFDESDIGKILFMDQIQLENLQ